jgi:hypothetical protein
MFSLVDLVKPRRLLKHKRMKKIQERKKDFKLKQAAQIEYTQLHIENVFLRRDKIMLMIMLNVLYRLKGFNS